MDKMSKAKGYLIEQKADKSSFKSRIQLKKTPVIKSVMGLLNRIASFTSKPSKSKQLAPSKINFLCSEQSGMLSEESLGDSFLQTRLKIKTETAKLQVVEKDGHWYALNSAQLQLCRHLEAEGRCTQVKIDRVRLSDVPKQLLQMMIPPESKQLKYIEDTVICDKDGSIEYKSTKSGPFTSSTDLAYSSGSESIDTSHSSRKSKKGYHKLLPPEQVSPNVPPHHCHATCKTIESLHHDVVSDDGEDEEDDTDYGSDEEDGYEEISEGGSYIFDRTDSESEWGNQDSEYDDEEYSGSETDEEEEDGDLASCQEDQIIPNDEQQRLL